ncbi:hypothetical protein HMPREF1544_11572 [Mucor circinelloides 1006PhL]|uniref:Uncharacterized protein n=1 Tax=Mucor circinelloides f. circinelloides (strain 1006PhL) TaxID=1220926 RepID=S2JGS7_MUCC1|nr:hypothetical protein HMPREF1544_11572 [Mucor circinelloides 1006PhL]
MERFQSIRKDDITFEGLMVDEATKQHESLMAKYDKKRADAYSVYKKGATSEMNSSVINSSIDKDYISESSSISSVLSNLVNEIRALRSSSVEQKETIQQQQNLIAQHSMVLQQQQQGGSTNNYHQRNSNNTGGEYQQQQRPFNEGCYNCGEYAHVVPL